MLYERRIVVRSLPGTRYFSVLHKVHT